MASLLHALSDGTDLPRSALWTTKPMSRNTSPESRRKMSETKLTELPKPRHPRYQRPRLSSSVHAARSSNKRLRSARPRMSSVPVACFHVSCNMHAYNDPQIRFPDMQRSPLYIAPTLPPFSRSQSALVASKGWIRSGACRIAHSCRSIPHTHVHHSFIL